MIANIGLTDRFIRLLFGIFVSIAHVNKMFSNTIDEVLLIAACVLIATVIFGICPLYGIFGINTNKTEKAH